MKLCIALDSNDNIALAKSVNNIAKSNELWLKVGLKSYIKYGREMIDTLKNINPKFKIFLDLKLYDIPNTMLDAFKECQNIGIDMLTIHTSAGARAMELLSQNNPQKIIILGVTALTSFEEDGYKAIYNKGIEQGVKDMASLAYQSGLDGVVSSVLESKMIKELSCNKLLTLTPGIRPFGESSDDQKRVADIKMAKENMSDFIVIGRPIYESKDPLGVVEKIYMEMAK